MIAMLMGHQYTLQVRPGPHKTFESALNLSYREAAVQQYPGIACLEERRIAFATTAEGGEPKHD
jgi:hypothetical protein